MTFNTGNPVPSTDARDLYDNAQNLDKFVNGQDLAYPDRLGDPRKSLAGIRQDAQDALSRLGYQRKGEYAAGLLIENYGEVFRKGGEGGEFYRASAELDLPYELTGNWGVEEALFVSVGDAVLRQDLAGSPLSGLGAGMVSGTAITLGSVYDLTQVSSALDGRTYRVSGYRPGSNKGGGEFIWRASLSKSLHDGVAVIDPSRPFPSDFNDTAQVSTWLTAGAGVGVFVKVWALARSGYESGMTDSASGGDRWMLSALLDSLKNQGGRLAILPFELSTVLPFTVEVPKGVALDLHGSTVEFQLTGGLRAFSLNSKSQLYNGTVTVVGTSPTGGGDKHAPVSGGNQSTGAGVSGVKVHDLTLSTNRANGNGVCFFGETTNSEFTNLTFPSSSTLGRAVALEWGGDTNGTGHPHNCIISNITCGTMSANVNGFMVWLSSAFNITVSNVYADSVYGLVGVFTGDRSNDYAPLRYRDLVGTGITVENPTCRSIRQYGIRCYGKGGLSTVLLPQSATIINPVLRSDGATADAVGIVCEFTDGVTIINPDISYMQVGISTGQDTRNMRVIGGKVWGNRASGLSIGSPAGGVARCSVEGTRVYGNNTGGYSGVGGAAGIIIQNCSDWTVKDCHFGIAGDSEGQQYSVRIESTAPGGLLKGNRTLGLAAGGAAYVNSSSTDYAVGTVGEDNTAAAGITVFGGAPIYFIMGNGLRKFIMPGAAAPTSGAWVRGEKCEFALPSAGGNIGAVCVTSGSPGTWKTFGGIAA